MHGRSGSTNVDMLSKNFNFVNDCEEHQRNSIIQFLAAGRRIQQGNCLGHSNNGRIHFSGVDLDSGALCSLTEYTISLSVLESTSKTVDEVIQDIERQVSILSSIIHKNLVAYKCVQCIKKKEYLFIYLCQEFIQGNSISCIYNSIGCNSEGASFVVKGVLEALSFLKSNGVSHSNLNHSMVFLDSLGVIRVSDYYSIEHYLEELSGNKKSVSNDLTSLGVLVESLLISSNPPMNDFVNRCKSERTLSASDLLEHPFLYPHHNVNSQTAMNKEPLHLQSIVFANRPQSSISLPNLDASISEKSRIKTEFEFINFIGEGGFGDVLEVRNKLDKRHYAIKRIKLTNKNNQICSKMTKEVELLSKLSHDNVVRYYNSWIESSAQDSEASDSDASDSDASNDADTYSESLENVKTNSDSVFMEFDEGYIDEEPKQDQGPRMFQCMYIQMEFCDKSTLRTAIDSGLYENKERYRRLFREIAEGLAHIHEQGIIHRDLKPANIFLDSKDCVKIGDFGLATTLDLPSNNQSSQIYGKSLTGGVGTTLYIAPELSGSASKCYYSQKVDIYSLGIILYEMCTPVATTTMERIETINALRTIDVTIPEFLLNDENCENEVKLLKWMLNHDASKRPTSKELLQSEMVPPAKLETQELQAMVRHCLATPQSRTPKHLISRWLTLHNVPFCELTYLIGTLQSSNFFESVKNKLQHFIHTYASEDILTPFKTNRIKELLVKAEKRHNATALQIDKSTRHCVDKISREKDIIFHNLLMNAQSMIVASRIVDEFEILKEKQTCFRINHTGLLKAIFLYCSVAEDKYKELVELLERFMDQKLSKCHLTSAVNNLLPGKNNISLIELLQIEMTVPNLHTSSLRTLIDDNGEASTLARTSLEELECVIKLAQQEMNVSIPIVVQVGLAHGFDCCMTEEIVWQLVGELKFGRKRIVLGHGKSLKNFHQCGINVLSHKNYIPEYTFNLEKIVLAISHQNDSGSQSVDVLVFVPASKSPGVMSFLQSLWLGNICFSVVESVTFNEDFTLYEDVGKELGADHIILLSEEGELRLKSWQDDIYNEQNVSRHEIVEYIKKY